MKAFKCTIVLFTIITFTSCKKIPTGVVLSANKTEIYSEQDVIFNLNAEDADSYEWDFGDGNKGAYGSGEVRWVYNTAGVYKVKVTAYSKKKKKMAESNTLTITVNKWNKYILGDYIVKDTTWSYATNSLQYRNYNVKIEDGGDVNGKSILISNLGNLFPTVKVKKEIYPNIDGGFTIFNSEINSYPFSNSNIWYQVFINFPPNKSLTSFKSNGYIKDETVIYTSSVTDPYFWGTSYWAKQ